MRSRLTAVGLAVVLALGLAACGDDGGGDDEASSEAAGVTTTTRRRRGWVPVPVTRTSS